MFGITLACLKAILRLLFETPLVIQRKRRPLAAASIAIKHLNFLRLLKAAWLAVTNGFIRMRFRSLNVRSNSQDNSRFRETMAGDGRDAPRGGFTKARTVARAPYTARIRGIPRLAVAIAR